MDRSMVDFSSYKELVTCAVQIAVGGFGAFGAFYQGIGRFGLGHLVC
jgi:hypothetical protein